MKAKQIVRGDVWRNKDVLAAAKSAAIRWFCVAYVTQASSRLFRRGDVLVCDASRKAVSCRETDPNFLLGLLKKGVAIYSCEALHAKCAVFDNYVLLGSANMSESSANRLIELSVLQKDTSLAMLIHAFIQGQIMKGVQLCERELEHLQKVWQNAKRKPWQHGLRKRKLSRRGSANHVVTLSPGTLRNVTDEEYASSEEKAKQHAAENGIAAIGCKYDSYHTEEKWDDKQPRENDTLIIVYYKSSKKNARARVFGPAPVVMVDKIRKTHIVHYLVPVKGIAYGKFKATFRGGKNMNRQCVKDDVFESMKVFIKRQRKK